MLKKIAKIKMLQNIYIMVLSWTKFNYFWKYLFGYFCVHWQCIIFCILTFSLWFLILIFVLVTYQYSIKSKLKTNRPPLSSSVCIQQLCKEESLQTNIYIDMCFRQRQLQRFTGATSFSSFLVPVLRIKPLKFRSNGEIAFNHHLSAISI